MGFILAAIGAHELIERERLAHALAYFALFFIAWVVIPWRLFH